MADTLSCSTNGRFATSRPSSAQALSVESYGNAGGSTASLGAAATSSAAGRKRPIPMIDLDSSPASSVTTSPFASSNSLFTANNGGFSNFAPVVQASKKGRQTKIWQPPCDPRAEMEMDVAIADLIHSNLLKFGLAEDPKFQRMLDIARRLPPTYKPPTRYHVGGKLLDKLYDVNWMQETSSLLKDSHTFGASLCGDGATQKTVPMINCLGAAVHNSFAMLDVFDCTDHCARGGKKDAAYISELFLGVIAKLEEMKDQYVSIIVIVPTL